MIIFGKTGLQKGTNISMYNKKIYVTIIMELFIKKFVFLMDHSCDGKLTKRTGQEKLWLIPLFERIYIAT